MQALTWIGPDQLEWREVSEPTIQADGEALVRPLAVATCDIDDLIVAGRAPFPPPFVLGHEGVAEVVDVGEAVSTVAPGDRVLVPFQINCGTCRACAEGRSGNCQTVPLASTYGFGFGEDGTRWGGFLADLIHVPYADAMLVPVPGGLSPEVAAGASDNLTDAWRAVGPPLSERPGAPVLVIGGASSGSIGLYAAAQAKALGSERVVYIDTDPERRSLAASYGVETVDGLPDQLDHRFPIVVEALGERAGLELALRSLGRDGICTSTAVYFGGDVEVRMPLLSMYMFVGTLTTGRLHARRDAPKVIDLLASGAFDPAPITTRVVPFGEAADALTSHDYTKLIFTP